MEQAKTEHVTKNRLNVTKIRLNITIQKII